MSTQRDLQHLPPERAMSDAEGQMKSLMDHAPFPMSLRDLEGRLQVVNRLGAELMGRAPESVLDRRPEELFDAETVAAWEEQERSVRSSGEATTFEMNAPLLDGSRRDYLVTKYPVRDGDGRLVGVGRHLTRHNRTQAGGGPAQGGGGSVSRRP